MSTQVSEDSRNSEEVGAEPGVAVAGSRTQVAKLRVALVVAVILALGFAVAWQHERSVADTNGRLAAAGQRQVALADAGRAAESAARAAVVAMTTYDYKSLDHDFSWVTAAGTTKFQAQYAEVSAPIRKLVLQLKAHAVGRVAASAANVADPDHVTVLLFVDQTLSNPGQARTSLDQPRVTMAMVRTDGRWLVDSVTVNTITGN